MLWAGYSFSAIFQGFFYVKLLWNIGLYVISVYRSITVIADITLQLSGCLQCRHGDGYFLRLGEWVRMAGKFLMGIRLFGNFQ